MNISSYFIRDRALFGGFPSQKLVEELEENGVRYFVNLTFSHEYKIVPYTTKYTSINYPISDYKVPTDWCNFSKFIIQVSNIIQNLCDKEKIYIHCKGGHGRVGIVVAVLLCYMRNITPEKALIYTNEYHNNRVDMREKWRRIGSPQTVRQKKFVCKFFEPLYFYKSYKTSITFGFSNSSPHSVDIPNFGKFPTAEAALQAYKNPKNWKYVNAQMNASNSNISKLLGSKCEINKEWETQKIHIMKKILELKFEQHPEIKKNIMKTGLRELKNSCKIDSYWGIGYDQKGRNILGKILCDLRMKFYNE